MRQRVNNEKPILELEEFNKISEEAKPALKRFFMPEQIQNKKRLVLFCYFLAGLNNRFINGNGIKAEIGYMLDSAGTSIILGN